MADILEEAAENQLRQLGLTVRLHHLGDAHTVVPQSIDDLGTGSLPTPRREVLVDGIVCCARRPSAMDRSGVVAQSGRPSAAHRPAHVTVGDGHRHPAVGPADAWRARYRPILAEVNDQVRPWSNFDDLHLVTLDDLLAERGIVLSLEERLRLVRAWHQLDPWPDVREGLDVLRRTRVTSALSNGHLALLIDLARRGDLRFDCQLSAEPAHAHKPAPEAYLTAARLLGVEPAELMLVAAHPWDLGGARSGATDRLRRASTGVRTRFSHRRRCRRGRVSTRPPRAGSTAHRALVRLFADDWRRGGIRTVWTAWR